MVCLVIFSCWFLATIADSKSLRRPSQEKILGGHDTDITKVPYIVSVQYNRSHVCGGCIIGSKYILTAAHCVEKRILTLFSIRAGSNYYYTGGQTLKVAEVISHPNYTTTTVDYDAAVLVLTGPLTFYDNVKLLHLAETKPRIGDVVLISGWGSIGEGKPFAKFLQSVSLPVVSRKDCTEKYGPPITKRMFCTSHPDKGKETCLGDSGGPAVFKGKLVGIVSWGEECGDKKTHGVYTNVASILPWVSTQVKE